MPNLVGMSYIDLLDSERRFFKVKVLLKPSKEKTGIIINQSVPADVSVAKGEEVTITVATKRAPPIIKTEIKNVPYVPSNSELANLRRQLEAAQLSRTVPDVVGVELTAAARVLKSLSFNVTSYGSGDVISVSPSPGSVLKRGARIQIRGGN
jgi:beta-lactam-binding protein with PASTA domain